MKINYAGYKEYISSIAKQLINTEFNSLFLINEKCLALSSNANDNFLLVISLDKHNPILYLQNTNKYFPSSQSKFIDYFKANIGKSQIQGINLQDHDFLIDITLLSVDELNFDRRFHLLLEMYSFKPNLYICDENYKILNTFCIYNEMNNKNQEIYKFSSFIIDKTTYEKINHSFFDELFKKEIEKRRLQKYASYKSMLISKIKSARKRIEKIKEDIKEAEKFITLTENLYEIYTLNFDLKSHVKSLTLSNGEIKLDESLSINENIEKMFSKSKKAKTTIALSNDNISRANLEIKTYQNILDKIDTLEEKMLDEMLLNAGLLKVKQETKITPHNAPWKLNVNGTIFLFGKNASQNDFLSFVYKCDRNFIWLHIKDYSGSHIIIKKDKPTENELLLACELALYQSKKDSGEVTYCAKKNVRRGKTLGEAIIKNYAHTKVNSVRPESKKIFETAVRLEN